MKSRTHFSLLLCFFLLLFSGCNLIKSNSILDIFAANYQVLQESVSQFETQNENFRKQLNQNESIGSDLRKALEETESASGRIRLKLTEHSQKLRELANMDNPNEAQDLDGSSANKTYWRDQDQAPQLFGQLREFEESLRNIKTIFSKKNLRLPEQFQAEVDEAKLSEGTLISSLCLVEGLKLYVLQSERELQMAVNQEVNVLSYAPEGVQLLSLPVSNVVPVGAFFETRLAIGRIDPNPKVIFNSVHGTFDQDKPFSETTLRIGAKGSFIPKNQTIGNQTFQANASYINEKGEMDDLTLEGEFQVHQPAIVVTSGSVQILYRQCGNDLNIDVPMLGDQYNPNIMVTKATVSANKISPKKVRIAPVAKTCRVTVSSFTNGQNIKIGDLDYRVIKPPKPTIELAINGKITDGLNPLPTNSRVKVRLAPDADFKAAMPEDANYGIASIEVLAQLSLGPPQQVNNISTSGKDATKSIDVSLGEKVLQSKPGTRVFIRLNEIYRKNFRGQKIPDKRFSATERTIALTLR